MVELTVDIIDVMKKIKDSINGTEFKINRFEVDSTGDGGEMITIDIRRNK